MPTTQDDIDLERLERRVLEVISYATLSQLIRMVRANHPESIGLDEISANQAKSFIYAVARKHGKKVITNPYPLD